MTRSAEVRDVLIDGVPLRVGASTDRRYWDVVAAGTWEPETLCAMRTVLGPQSTFIDVGAWIGSLSLFAAALGATVTAFEFDPAALERLDRNLALNPHLARRVTVHRVGLAPRSGEGIVASQQLGNSMTSLIRRNAESAKVPLLGTKEAINGGLLDGDMIKIDVEGGEWRLIPRLSRYLRIRQPVLLLSTHSYYLDEWISTRLPKSVRHGMKRMIAVSHAIAGRSLRCYPYWYVADAADWRRVTKTEGFRAFARLGEKEFLLSARPLVLR